MWLGRRSSWAMGHSATIAGGPIGTLPCGPTTWVNIDVGSTSTSRSHGSVSALDRVDLGDHRIDEPRRQPATDPGDQPDRRCPTPMRRQRSSTNRSARPHARSRWPTPRPARRRPARTPLRRHRHRPVRSRRRSARGDARTTWPCEADVEREHADVTTTDQARHRSRSGRRSSPRSHRREVRRRVRRRSDRCGSRSASSHTASNGSDEVDTFAHNHQSAPVNG